MFRQIRFTPLLAGALALSAAARAAAPDANAYTLSYRLSAGKAVRYKLVANVIGSMPLFDSPTPVDLEANLTLVYLATPKTVSIDGTSNVEFVVESADAELAKIPFPVPIEEAQKILNQSVTFSKTGEVKKLTSGKDLPFGVSIPGVDPKRLYALIFPVVFQAKAVKPGDSWKYKSELLGSSGKPPSFTATVLPGSGTGSITKLSEKFDMAVDLKLDKDKKLLKAGEEPYRTRKGTIAGTGTLNFDRAKGLFTRSDVRLKATIVEDLLGAPLTPEDPKQVISKVDAKVTIELQTATPATGAKPEKRDK